MLLGGIASTADEDSDGEFLDPRGFDIKPLLKSGLVNWHHQAKTNPGTIVGEPTKAEIRKEGLYIETKLYPHSQVACDIWELAKTLAADSQTRRLGYSIEGKVIKRKSEDPMNPDYKKIVKAVITGVAITHQPKNPKTFASIIKGEIDDELDDNEEPISKEEKDTEDSEEKSVNTEDSAALKKESVDDKLKVTTFGKAEVLEKLFNDIPGISIEKAKQIYVLIENISMKKDPKQITDEDIQKAYDMLGIQAPEMNIVKGDDDSEEKPNFDDDESDEPNKPEDERDDEEEEESKEPEEEGDEDDEEDEPKRVVRKAAVNSIGLKFQRIEDAIAASHNTQSKYVKALGVMVKAQSDQLEKAQRSLDLAIETIERQNDIIKGYEARFDSIDSQIADFGTGVPAPKSVRNAHPVERSFGKANTDDDLVKGGNSRMGANQVSIKNRAAVAEILDQATFAKGYDEDFSKACTAFEAGADLPNSIIARIKNEYNIEIVR